MWRGRCGGTATCTPAGNNFTGGIDYDVNDATIVVQDGVIVSTAAANTSGITTQNTGGTTTINAGTVSGTGTGPTYGVYALSTGGSIDVTMSDVTVTNGSGILALTNGAGVTVTTNGTVATTGNGYDAIYAVGSGAISVTTNGLVSSSGTGDADGIVAYSYTSTVAVTATDITTSDDGIAAYGATGATITTTGTVTAGDEGMEITTGSGGDVIISVNNVTATGSNNDAVRATSGGAVSITVSGAVLGGATSSGGDGIDIRASTVGTITIQSGASVGALSDFAIDNAGAGALTINNSGSITGSVIFGSNNDVLNNLSSNSVNQRRFTDTNADGVRDREAVAIIDFGTGTDTFNNAATGVLNLSTVTGATAFNTTNETFATGAVGLSLTTEGIEQGHLINLETFINSGIISLADGETGRTGPVAGDVLVITSLSAPGAGGTANFISNGGELHLDTLLNNGAVDTTDVLIVDTVTTGAGPTRITITDAGGTGAVTGTGATDGILVVEVRGAASAANAFTLERAVVGGVFEYELAQADGQNWYLQSDGSLATQIAAYRAIPLALSGFTRDQPPWAQKRWGHLDGSVATKTGAWMRGGYVRGEAEAGTAENYENRDRFVQAGYDVTVNVDMPGTLSVGAMAQYASTDTGMLGGNGSKFNAAGVGVGASLFCQPPAVSLPKRWQT